MSYTINIENSYCMYNIQYAYIVYFVYIFTFIHQNDIQWTIYKGLFILYINIYYMYYTLLYYSLYLCFSRQLLRFWLALSAPSSGVNSWKPRLLNAKELLFCFLLRFVLKFKNKYWIITEFICECMQQQPSGCSAASSSTCWFLLNTL